MERSINGAHIQGKSIQGRRVGSSRKRQHLSDSGMELRNVWPSYRTSENWGPESAGHSPVDGDSLLTAQAGGGSCTRSGELKLRRKDVD